MQVNVMQWDKKTVVEQLELDERIFNAKVNMDLIHQVICKELSNCRLGTASTKSKGQITGSGRKPWRQKGTGRARAGSVKSPLWRGGGVIFGPSLRSYKVNVPKKMRRLSVFSILNSKLNCNQLYVIDSFQNSDLAKTKEMAELLLKITRIKDKYSELKNNRFDKKLKNYKLVVIIDESKKSWKGLTRNLSWVKCLYYNQLNSYDLFYSDEVLIDKSTLLKLQQFYCTDE